MKSKSKSKLKSEELEESRIKPYFKTLFFADLLVLFLIILGSVLIYNAHTKLEAPIFETKNLSTSNVSLGNYPYPLHFDEFNHISQAKQIMEEGLKANTNPQLYNGGRHVSLEKGFHVLLAGISFITGVSLIKLSLILPAIFFGLGALLVYLFFSRSLKKPIVGIFSILFLIFVPSNVNILGFWFLTPSSLTLIFIGGLLLLFYEIKRPRNIIFGALLTFVSFFIYPIITILLLLIFVLFIVFEYKVWNYLKSGKKWLVILGAVFFGLILFFLRKKLVFDPGWTNVGTTETILTIWTYVLPIVIIFAIGGLFYMYLKDKFIFSVIAIYSLFGVLSTISYLFFEYGFIMPYQRMLFQWGVLLSIAAGYGVYFMIDLFIEFTGKIKESKKVSKKESEKKIKRRIKKAKKVNIYFISSNIRIFLQVFLVLIVVVLVLLLFLPKYYVVKPTDFAIQHIVHPEQAKLLSYINTSQPKAVLADPYFSAAIYPLSKHKAVATLDGNLDGGKYVSMYDELMRKGGVCELSWDQVHRTTVDFVIINRHLYCSFFKEISNEGDYYLYMVIPDLLPFN